MDYFWKFIIRLVVVDSHYKEFLLIYDIDYNSAGLIVCVRGSSDSGCELTSLKSSFSYFLKIISLFKFCRYLNI